MDVMALWDTGGAAIVLGGTLLATVMGSGRHETAAALRAIGHLAHPFDYAASRAEIARDVEAIRMDGVLRSRPCRSSDSEIAQATKALIHDRSLQSLIDAHDRCKRLRSAGRELALQPLHLAGEMAPVFGMAGTLFSLSQLQYGGGEQAALMTGVAMAIVTTLYGLLLAHLVFLPLARLVERRGTREEHDRQLLIDWLTAQLAASCPPSPRGNAGRNAGAARLEAVV